MLYYVLLVHWFGDFYAQTRWQADNKSKKWIPLICHVATYTIILGLLIFPFCSTLKDCLVFTIINGLAHLLVDSITAPISKRFYEMGNIHAFFCTVGFDQFLHTSCLILTSGLIK